MEKNTIKSETDDSNHWIIETESKPDNYCRLLLTMRLRLSHLLVFHIEHVAIILLAPRCFCYLSCSIWIILLCPGAAVWGEIVCIFDSFSLICHKSGYFYILFIQITFFCLHLICDALLHTLKLFNLSNSHPLYVSSARTI